MTNTRIATVFEEIAALLEQHDASAHRTRVHELGRTADWLVIYYHLPHQPEGQATIVTEWRGPARGQRVVRGRERESAIRDAA